MLGPLAIALRESWREYAGKLPWRADLLAGLTVGIVAVPLAMALAIASGMPPQNGLYTAVVAGSLIAIFGGSRVSVSGPTAAFVVILHPISLQFGVGGLLLASLFAGILLVLMGVARMGQWIQFIPYPITTGFTSGIALVIASLQFKDFLGLRIVSQGDGFFERMAELARAVHTFSLENVIVGLVTLGILIVWRYLPTRIPGHLAALMVSTLGAWAAVNWFPGLEIHTIATRFSYSDGVTVLAGIPPLPPELAWPWTLSGADGKPLTLSFDLVRQLVGPACAIALLGAIESLLCAVVADGMAGTKHDPDAELIGQGIGNIAGPFFGGFAATGAIARTATNIRSGARTPIAALAHALVVLAAIVLLTPVLNHIPMAALAALLLMVAWNMAEVKHFGFVLRIAPSADRWVLVTCFTLTVVFDMVIAIGVGMVLASLLFIKRMAEVARVSPAAQDHPTLGRLEMPSGVRMYEVAGPLFFGAAEKALATLGDIDARTRVVILSLDHVPVMDITGLVALTSIIKSLRKRGIGIVFAGMQTQPRELLHRAAEQWEAGVHFYPDVRAAISAIQTGG